MTFQATYTSGWHATVVADTLTAARQRFQQTGRGERFALALLSEAQAAVLHHVWGRDEDDDYEDGE